LVLILQLEVFLYATDFRLALGPTHPRTQWQMRASTAEGKQSGSSSSTVLWARWPGSDPQQGQIFLLRSPDGFWSSSSLLCASNQGLFHWLHYPDDLDIIVAGLGGWMARFSFLGRRRLTSLPSCLGRLWDPPSLLISGCRVLCSGE